MTLGPKKAPLSITIVGDLRVEVRAKVPNISFQALDHDTAHFAGADLAVAGTAFNMARASAEIFETVRVVTRIGHDAISPFLIEATLGTQAKWHVVVDESCKNPPIVIVRDSSRMSPGGVRLLISGDPAPYHHLSISEIEQHCQVFASSDIVFLDGYSLLSPTSRAAVGKVFRIAQESDTTVCVDVVPHDLDRRIDRRHLMDFMSGANIVIIEARTLCRIFAITPPHRLDDADLTQIVESLPESMFAERVWLLRYGAGEISRTAICRPGAEVTYYDTGYADATEKAGFGDFLAAREIAMLLLGHWSGQEA